MSMTDAKPSRAAPAQLASVFPLPLSTMEAFMLMDSTPDYPMMCDLELSFQGRIDRVACEEALAFALARNLLFCCTIERLPNGELAWHDRGLTPPVKWVDLAERLDDSYDAPIDFSSQPGLRIWVRLGADESKLLLNFHHACGDGMGVFGFIEDFLVGYHNAFPGNHRVEARPLEVERLLTRGEMSMGGRSFWRRFTDVFVGAYEGIKLLAQQPAPLACEEGGGGYERPRPSFITVQLAEATTSGLRRLASNSGATTNDLLLRELFVTLSRWNEARGDVSPRRRLRILMPQNLREAEDYKMPLASAMSFAFLTRQVRWRERPAAFLKSIRDETETIRKTKHSLYFLGGMGTMRAAGLLKLLVRGPFCFATTVLSNLGDSSKRFIAALPRVDGGLQAGNVVYRYTVGVPPARPRTNVLFTITNLGPTMSVTFRWDHRLHSPQEGRSILDEYVRQLEETARQFETSATAKESVALSKS